jgi:PleD family two-component response regulator
MQWTIDQLEVQAMQNLNVVRPFPIAQVSEGAKPASMRVLIADDHDLVRETIAAFLKGEGIVEVVTVPTLDDAIRASDESGSFDLVLLDYNMPGMNGLEGLTRMIAANDRRPVALRPFVPGRPGSCRKPPPRGRW